MITSVDYRNKIISDYMGKIVHVVIDRPVGYHHGDIIYPVNYGYIPGVIAGDGEEQDAYILGISEPLSAFDGQVVGAVRRTNDCEDKLVVAPVGERYNQAQIAEAVYFQEKYFVSTIDSLLRKSCGVIPYRISRGEKEYLILLQRNNCWSFPKGHMEAGETVEETALRELKEETGLSAILILNQQVVLEYDIPPYTKKQVVLFLGQVDGNVSEQESEIINHKWVNAEELREYVHSDTYEACLKLLE